MGPESKPSLGRAIPALLVTGAALSVNSQLRLVSIPFGPGEGIIAVAMLLALAGARVPARTRLGGRSSEFLAYWVVAAVLLALGTMSGSVVGADPGPSAAHDAFAYLFVALFCIALESYSFNSPRHVLRMLIYAIASVLLLTGVAALTTREIAGLQLWYDGIRLRGLAENPNQLALLVVPFPLLCWQLLYDSRETKRWLLWGGSAVGLVIGAMTLSDALLVAWTVAMMTVLLSRVLGTWLQTRSAMIALFLSALGLTIVSMLLFSGAGRAVTGNVYWLAVGAYESGSQGSVRIALWKHAVEALTRSHMLGLGPGAHSGVDGPFQRMEAHSMYLDWATASGVLGLVLLVAVLGVVITRCIGSKKFFLAGAVLGLMVFGLFHHSLRQPIFWCYLITISYYAKYVRSDRRAPGH